MAIYRPIYTCCKTDIFFTWCKNLFFRTVHDCVIGGVFWGFVADYKKQYRINYRNSLYWLHSCDEF